MKYDTNKNPVEVAGSITDYNFEKNDLETAGDTNKVKTNKQENHDRKTSKSGNLDIEIWIISAPIVFLGIILITELLGSLLIDNMTIQDAIMSLGVI